MTKEFKGRIPGSNPKGIPKWAWLFLLPLIVVICVLIFGCDPAPAHVGIPKVPQDTIIICE